VAELYAISRSPSSILRYIMLLVMVLATFGALYTYLRGRLRFRYGAQDRLPGRALFGILAASTALGMGW